MGFKKTFKRNALITGETNINKIMGKRTNLSTLDRVTNISLKLTNRSHTSIKKIPIPVLMAIFRKILFDGI